MTPPWKVGKCFLQASNRRSISGRPGCELEVRFRRLSKSLGRARVTLPRRLSLTSKRRLPVLGLKQWPFRRLEARRHASLCGASRLLS